MRSPKSAAILVVLLALAGAGWWFLFVRSPASAELEVRTEQSLTDAREIEAASSDPKVEPEERPEEIETVPLVAEEEVLRRSLGDPIVPQYGPLLERNRAQAVFDVRDARGERLWSWGWKTTTERLWLKEGSYWKRVRVHFDRQGQRLRRPDEAPGLEPGSYELEFAAGSYGKASTRFEITRDGTDVRSDLRLPGYLRVVTLNFVDEDGQSISHLTSPPQYRCGKTPHLSWRRAAPGVLRDPPGIWEESFGMGGRSSSRGIHRWSKTLLPTDGGRYHLRVIAGGQGEIHLHLGTKLYEERQLLIKSDFSGPEWDDYTVVLKRKPDFAEKVAKYKVRRADNPGNRLALRREEPRQADPKGPRVRAPVSSRQWRLLVELSAPEGIFPLVRRNGRYLQSLSEGSDGAWWTDSYDRGWSTLLNTTDGRFYRGAPQELKESPVGTVQRVVRAESAAPCRFSLRSSPTLAAWARGVSFALRARDDALLATLPHCKRQERAEREGTEHVYETWIAAPWREKLQEWARVKACFGVNRTTLLTCTRSGNYGIDGGGRSLSFALKLNPRERKELTSGLLELDLREVLARQKDRTILSFRCVGDHEEGVPWVEASVLPAETVELAETMRGIAAKLDEKGKRPAIGSLIEKNGAFEEEIGSPSIHEDDIPSPEEDLPGLTDEKLRTLFGDELFELYGPRALHRLRYHGAWYDTRSKFSGDEDGYVVTRRPALKAGRLYVLYLWGKSRDDLEPDRKIVFQTTAGITDLGVLRLSSH